MAQFQSLYPSLFGMVGFRPALVQHGFSVDPSFGVRFDLVTPDGVNIKICTLGLGKGLQEAARGINCIGRHGRVEDGLQLKAFLY